MAKSIVYRLSNVFDSKGPDVDDMPLLKKEPPSVISAIEHVHEDHRAFHHFFRPSGLMGCRRSNVLHYTHAPMHPQRQGDRMRRILENGNKVHEIIQGYLADHPDVWFAPETRVTRTVEGLNIRGSCDGILIRRSDRYRWGIEIKTKAHKAFTELTEPDEAHVFQASIYAVLSGVWWITILYWDKDKHYLKEFPIEFDPKVWSTIKRRVRELKPYVEAVQAATPYTKEYRRALPTFKEELAADRCDPGFCAYVDYCKAHGGRPEDVPPKPWERFG